MPTDYIAEEARRREEKAMSLIRSAYRLHPLEPARTIQKVRTAIAWGAEEMAEDLVQEAQRV